MKSISKEDYNRVLLSLEESPEVHFSHGKSQFLDSKDLYIKKRFVLHKSQTGFSLRMGLGPFRTGMISILLVEKEGNFILKKEINKLIIILVFILLFLSLSIISVIHYLELVPHILLYYFIYVIFLVFIIGMMMWVEWRCIKRFIFKQVNRLC